MRGPRGLDLQTDRANPSCTAARLHVAADKSFNLPSPPCLPVPSGSGHTCPPGVWWELEESRAMEQKKRVSFGRVLQEPWM